MCCNDNNKETSELLTNSFIKMLFYDLSWLFFSSILLKRFSSLVEPCLICLSEAVMIDFGKPFANVSKKRIERETSRLPIRTPSASSRSSS